MYGAYGAIPDDGITAVAKALLDEIAQGGDGFATLNASDGQTKASACQRAIDILNLPACDPKADPGSIQPGTCLNRDMLNMSVDAMKQKVVAACQAQGVTVSAGMSTTTKYLLIAGGGALLIGILYAASHKKKAA